MLALRISSLIWPITEAPDCVLETTSVNANVDERDRLATEPGWRSTSSEPVSASLSALTLPISSGLKTLTRKNFRAFHPKPCLSAFSYNLCPSGTWSPRGSPNHLKHCPAVLPKMSKYNTTTMKVPFTIVAFAPACSSLSTQSPSSKTNTKDTPPRSPECHIMNMCFQVMTWSLSLGRLWATVVFMTLDSILRGTTEAILLTPPFTSFVATKTAMMPLNRKITVSMRLEICFSKKEHKAMLSADKCGGT
eukprot:CAMPEP_0115348740 /NCGR_PEP_ID=MMETSP0270-20121206/95559_1 /TAXON_ID=71861 /ORGANISM="Scrippsiella trochoidea, Strain CCMP3099" /LENGTH=248 /DNA_ID=CAMNT_0002770717 /DNA_START=247 /DNA_END=993 /DNA_ORIENTATION=+